MAIVLRHDPAISLLQIDGLSFEKHGHTFWVTGHEEARIFKSAWIPRNTQLIAVAQASTFEFVANNPGDWMFHCHMVHGMMNHMVPQVGPRIRGDATVDRYLDDLNTRPTALDSKTAEGDVPPGYPQKIQGMSMSPDFMKKLWAVREMKGMRTDVAMSMAGLMTSMRVLPEDLYHRVMETDENIPKGAIFEEIVRRSGEVRRSPQDVNVRDGIRFIRRLRQDPIQCRWFGLAPSSCTLSTSAARKAVSHFKFADHGCRPALAGIFLGGHELPPVVDRSEKAGYP